MISDTVGFIQKLPTTLVAAFRATLEEVTEANSRMIAWSMPRIPTPSSRSKRWKIRLAQIDMPRIPRILALNKIDEMPELPPAPKTAEPYDAVVPISALKGTGLKDLLAEIERVMIENMEAIEVKLPYRRGDLLALIRENGVVDEETADEEGVLIRAHVPPRLAARFRDHAR
ncbi:MAG: hypothetical protein U0528_16350 [Anaerolineae bacterium]